jgi:hypothetical protein
VRVDDVVANNSIHTVEISDRVNLLQPGRIDNPVAKTSAEELTDRVTAEYRTSKAAPAAASS